ncbi:MAG: AraC family transcriptional regulator, partial [Muribaculaceae bacterium]|nr:AraC family transcriptional regulator [Muribaculaceae bacterium]
HLTIEAIVAELGFRSRSTFSKTFKRITGLSPSEFQRMARSGASPGSDSGVAEDTAPEGD